MAAESISSGLTFDEFAMGVQAHLYATADANVYSDPGTPWDAKRGMSALESMSDADPDFYCALTDADPHSQGARHLDARVKTILALSGTVELPEGPGSAEFEALLRQSSVGSNRDWHPLSGE